MQIPKIEIRFFKSKKKMSAQEKNNITEQINDNLSRIFAKAFKSFSKSLILEIPSIKEKDLKKHWNMVFNFESKGVSETVDDSQSKPKAKSRTKAKKTDTKHESDVDADNNSDTPSAMEPSEPENKGCKHIMIRGTKQGKPCGDNKLVENSEFCKTHKKQNENDKSKKDKKVVPILGFGNVDDSPNLKLVKKPVRESPKLKKNMTLNKTHNMYIHKESQFAKKSKDEEFITHRLDKDNMRKINVYDIEDLKKYNFSYKETDLNDSDGKDENEEQSEKYVKSNLHRAIGIEKDSSTEEEIDSSEEDNVKVKKSHIENELSSKMAKMVIEDEEDDADAENKAEDVQEDEEEPDE